jgi:hypothetical protein
MKVKTLHDGYFLPISHSTIATTLKNKSKVMEAVKGSLSLTATRCKNSRRVYIKYGETFMT